MKTLRLITILAVLLGAARVDAALTDSLISYWKLDEASGNAVDAHGSNALTDNNTVGSGTGLVYANARDFEKDNTEYLSTTSNASLQVGDIDFTIAAWVKYESVANFMAIATKFGNEYIVDNSNGFRFLVQTSAGSNVSVTLPGGNPSTGSWYFVVAWHDATANTINIQVNNGTPESAAHSTGVRTGTSDFVIGGRQGGGTQLFDGLIGPVMFWKRVLTSDERTSLYNSGNGLGYEDFSPPASNRNQFFLMQYAPYYAVAGLCMVAIKRRREGRLNG